MSRSPRKNPTPRKVFRYEVDLPAAEEQDQPLCLKVVKDFEARQNLCRHDCHDESGAGSDSDLRTQINVDANLESKHPGLYSENTLLDSLRTQTTNKAERSPAKQKPKRVKSSPRLPNHSSPKEPKGNPGQQKGFPNVEKPGKTKKNGSPDNLATVVMKTPVKNRNRKSKEKTPRKTILKADDIVIVADVTDEKSKSGSRSRRQRVEKDTEGDLAQKKINRRNSKSPRHDKVVGVVKDDISSPSLPECTSTAADLAQNNGETNMIEQPELLAETVEPTSSVDVVASLCSPPLNPESGPCKTAADTETVQTPDLTFTTPPPYTYSQKSDTENRSTSAEPEPSIVDLDCTPSSQQDPLAFLSQQLCSLNAESAHITTHIHRRSGATPQRGRADGTSRRSLSTPRKYSLFSPHLRSSARSPRSTPRKLTAARHKTPLKVRFPFTVTPSKSPPSARGLSTKKAQRVTSPLKFPTPCKTQTKRKLYSESPPEEDGANRKKTKRRSASAENIDASEACSGLPSLQPSSASSAEPTASTSSCSINPLPSSPASPPLSPTGALRIAASPELPPLDELDADVDEAVESTCEKIKLTNLSPTGALRIAASPELHPLDEMDAEVDEAVESTCEKIKLTEKNIRSIIRQLITNEHVQDMVRNTLMQEDGCVQNRLKEAIFEPKLTRSKLKEVIEKGQIPLPAPWTVSPLKPAAKAQPSFLDLSFPDDDDDDEYHPGKDELEHWSDDESVVSSQASDYESPRPVSVTPRGSQRLSSTDSDILTPTASDSDRTLTAMGPPSAPPWRRRLALTAATDQQTEEDPGIIAFRTRSKLCLSDTPLDVIESGFVAPDITPDIYYDSTLFGDDEEWQSFLTGLTKHEVHVDTEAGDDEDDPEYNFMQDEHEDEDDEEIRNDKATRISKKEVNELLREVFEDYESETSEPPPTDGDTSIHDVSQELTSDIGDDGSNFPPIDDGRETQQEQPTPTYATRRSSQGQGTSSGVTPASSSVLQADETFSEQVEKSSFQYPGHIPPLRFDPSLVNMFVSELVKIKASGDGVSTCSDETTSDDVPEMSTDELLQLKDQMRKHVQLLAQTFVQATPSNDVDLCEIASTASIMINELQQFACQSKLSYRESHFCPTNLDAAVAITREGVPVDTPEQSALIVKAITESTMARRLYDIQGLTYQQMKILATNPVFIFPQMLPEARFILESELERKCRIYFSESEDNLLAMGLDQFGHLPNKYTLIHEFLLPTKSTRQLTFRYKNLKSSRNKLFSAIKYFAKHRRLPEFKRFLTLEPDNEIIAPLHRNRSQLPKWFRAFEDAMLDHTFHSQMPQAHGGSPRLIGFRPSTPSEVEPVFSMSGPSRPVTRRSSAAARKKVAAKLNDDVEPGASRVSKSVSATAVNSLTAGSPLVLLPASPYIAPIASPAPAVAATSNAVIVTGMRTASSIVVSENQRLPIATAQSPQITLTSVAGTTGGGPMIILSAAQLQQLGISVNMLPLTTVTSSKVVPGNQASGLSPSCINISSVADNQQMIGSPYQYSQMNSDTSRSFVTPQKVAEDDSSPNLLGRALASAMGIPFNQLEHLNQQAATAEPQVVDFTQPAAPHSTGNQTACAMANNASNFSGVAAIQSQQNDNCSSFGNDTTPSVSVSNFQMNDSGFSLPADMSDVENSGTFPRRKSTERPGGTTSDIFLHCDIDSLPTLDIGMLNSSLSPPSLPQNSCDSNADSVDPFAPLSTPKKPGLSQDTHQPTQLHFEVLRQAAALTSQGLGATDSVELHAKNDGKKSVPAALESSVVSNDKMSSGSSDTKSPKIVVASLSVAIQKDGAIPAQSVSNAAVQKSSTVLPSHTMTRSQHRASLSTTYHSRSPAKSLATDNRYILPSRHLPAYTSPLKPVSPLLPKLRSGRNAATASRSATLPIAPKSVGATVVKVVYSSPVKKAAASISARARKLQGRRGQQIDDMQLALGQNTSRSTAGCAKSILPKLNGTAKASLQSAQKLMSNLTHASASKLPASCSEYVDMPAFGFDDDGDKCYPVSDEETGVDADSQAEDEDEDGCIGKQRTSDTGCPVVHESSPNVSKTRRKQQQLAAAFLLSESLNTDAQREERETRCAQLYLRRVYNVVRADNNECIYSQLLQVLMKYGQIQSLDSVVPQLYKDVEKLLSPYPELLDDFAMFLLPGQAVDCGCFMGNLQFTAAASFVSKLEVCLEKNATRRRRVLRVFRRWSEGGATDKELRDIVLPLIRFSPQLVDEFLQFFDDAPPPPCRTEDFEEVTIGDSDDEMMCGELAEFEKVELPGTADTDGYGTPHCPCTCHRSAANSRRIVKHCESCSLRVIRGRLYIQVSDKVLRPASVVYHSTTNNNNKPAASLSSPQQEKNPSSRLECGTADHSDHSSSPPQGVLACGNQQAASSMPPTIRQSKTVSDSSGQSDNNCFLAAASVTTTKPENSPVVTGDMMDGISETVTAVDSVEDHSVVVDIVSARMPCEQLFVAPSDGADELLMAGEGTDEVGSSLQPAQREWTCDENRLILESCRDFGPSLETFSQIATTLTNCTTDEVAEQFNYLLSFLM